MKASHWMTCPGKRQAAVWIALLGALALVVACAPKKPVYIPTEWQPPPPVQAPSAPPPAPAPKAAAIMKPPPVIKESDIAPAPLPDALPAKSPEKKPVQPPPQRVASMHLVDQAKASLAQGKADPAIPLLEQAIQVDVHNGEAFFTLARAWRLKGARQKALQFAQKAEILSQDDPAKLKQVYLLEADLHKELGDAAKADAYRQKASKLR
jgi:hypothetical protein